MEELRRFTFKAPIDSDFYKELPKAANENIFTGEGMIIDNKFTGKMWDSTLEKQPKHLFEVNYDKDETDSAGYFAFHYIGYGMYTYIVDSLPVVLCDMQN